jgi:predicted amidohydrolase
MRVAAIQFAPAFREPETNLRVAAGMVVGAVKGGAKLVVLPELCTTGYSFMGVAEAEPFAEVLEQGRSYQVFRELATKLDVGIAWGFMRRDPGSGDLYNSQGLVLPTGQYASYDKINLWGQDYLWATEGSGSPPILDYLGQRVGLLICRDVRDKAPAWDEFYEPGDADVIAFSTNWGDGGFPSVKWVDFAKQNRCWLVVGNRYGREANNDFGEGGPCVIAPSGQVHCEGLVWSQPCTVYGETT